MTRYREAELEGFPATGVGDPFSNWLVTVEGNPEDFPIQDYDTFYNLMEDAVPAELKSVVNPRREDTDGDGIWDTMEWDNIPNLRSTQDRVAEGFELELTANVTPGWRILGNISQQETIQSNTAVDMASVVEEFNQKIQSTRLGELRSLEGNTVIRPINFNVVGVDVAQVRNAVALDNTVSNEQREWRFTGITNYEFMEGALRGFSVGGAARWEDEAATGYVFFLDEESGVPIPDVNRPYFDDGLFSGDLWIGYRRKILDGKVDWKIQLNVRNAFGDDDDIPVKTNPDGQVAVVRIPNPRTVYLSNSFRF
jgi:hypothetical protein